MKIKIQRKEKGLFTNALKKWRHDGSVLEILSKNATFKPPNIMPENEQNRQPEFMYFNLREKLVPIRNAKEFQVISELVEALKDEEENIGIIKFIEKNPTGLSLAETYKILEYFVKRGILFKKQSIYKNYFRYGIVT